MLITNFLCIMAMACIISLPIVDSDAYPLNETIVKERVVDPIGPKYDTTVLRLLTLYGGELATKTLPSAVREPSTPPKIRIRKRDDGDEPSTSGEEEGEGNGITLAVDGDAEDGGDGATGGDADKGGDEHKGEDGVKEDGLKEDGAGDKAKGGDDGAGGTGGGQYGGTQSQLVRDKIGNWIYNLWGATYGQVGQDTRFAVAQTINRIKVDSNPTKDFSPDGGNMSTVCMDASTIYNVPIVKNWLQRKIYSQPLKTRPIWKELRMHIYKMGDSEECHNLTRFPKWRDYQECAIRRNMRLESIIPMYPMQQMGDGL